MDLEFSACDRIGGEIKGEDMEFFFIGGVGIVLRFGGIFRFFVGF